MTKSKMGHEHFARRIGFRDREHVQGNYFTIALRQPYVFLANESGYEANARVNG